MEWCNSGSRNMKSYAEIRYDRIGSFKAVNFDHGLVLSNPDDSSRSFSARFAVPSRIFERGEMV
ncbi:hypothetical protein NC653_001998 [Populus alba x Populus x berolinensis]|uniref:Uncharacterized protein n=1 Tax=Populus alba x Populus x berolinensis TaxID=444605 RepID=A0AAD6RMN9_9ROSI|nr:hypothetical protein NC653_001998 [Populus alba x Populus x berolinensis]